jgi:hypothetical protein
MCEYPSGTTTWREGEGLQVQAGPTLSSHSAAVALHGLEGEPTLRRWEGSQWPPQLSHNDPLRGTPEEAVWQTELVRLYPTLDKLLVACVRSWGGKDVSAEDRGCALRSAARNGHLACVKAVLASGPISVNDRGCALRSAARNGHTDCAALLRETAEVAA